MKTSGNEDFVWNGSFITKSVCLIGIDLFRYSVSSCVTFSNLYFSRSFLSKLLDLLTQFALLSYYSYNDYRIYFDASPPLLKIIPDFGNISFIFLTNFANSLSILFIFYQE